MTKSIEEQAREYRKITGYTGNVVYVDAHFLAGAKARDIQWLKVVNELREALKFTPLHACQTGDCDHSFQQSCTKTFREYVDDSLTKADQMMKEMGIK